MENGKRKKAAEGLATLERMATIDGTLNELLSAHNAPVEIKKVLKNGGLFYIEFFNGGTCNVLMKELASFFVMRNEIALATKVFLDDKLKKDWPKVVQTILNVAESKNTNH